MQAPHGHHKKGTHGHHSAPNNMESTVTTAQSVTDAGKSRVAQGLQELQKARAKSNRLRSQTPPRTPPTRVTARVKRVMSEDQTRSRADQASTAQRIPEERGLLELETAKSSLWATAGRKGPNTNQADVSLTAPQQTCSDDPSGEEVKVEMKELVANAFPAAPLDLTSAKGIPALSNAKKRLRGVAMGLQAASAMQNNATNSIFEALEKHKEKKQLTEWQVIYRCAWTLSPDSFFRVAWDVGILCLVIITSLWQPVRVALYSGLPTQWWELCMDCMFAADIFLTFMTAYYRGLELVTSKKEIGKRYLSGWFWLDFVATVPWGAISDMIATPSAFAAQLISLLRLLKLFRLARITPLVTRLTATSTINTGFVNAAKFLFYVLIMAHLLGCMFLVVPLVFPSDSEPWTSVYKIDNMTKDEQYINALYWSLTTMTTIGYGDRGPQTKHEIVFTMASELIGLSFFALLLNEIVDFFNLIGKQQREFDDKKNSLVQYIKFAGLDRHGNDGSSSTLTQDVLKFLNFKFGKVSTQLNLEDLDGFSDLSPSLQGDMRRAINLPVLQRMFFFGVSPAYKTEQKSIQEMFDRYDGDGIAVGNERGSLDTREIEALISDMDIQMTNEQLQEAIQVMDADQEGTVSLDEFMEWWFSQKCGEPFLFKVHEHSARFMNVLAECLLPLAISDGDTLVRRGDYGQTLFIMTRGTIAVQRDFDESDVQFFHGNAKFDEAGIPEPLIIKQITSRADRADSPIVPIVGWAAVLKGNERESVDEVTRLWEVVAPKEEALRKQHEDGQADTKWKSMGGNFCEVYAIDSSTLQDVMDKYMERVGANYWTGLARREYKTILKKDLKPRAVTMANSVANAFGGRAPSPSPPLSPRASRKAAWATNDEIQILQEDAVRDRAATNKRLSAIENKIDLLLKKEGLL